MSKTININKDNIVDLSSDEVYVLSYSISYRYEATFLGVFNNKESLVKCMENFAGDKDEDDIDIDRVITEKEFNIMKFKMNSETEKILDVLEEYRECLKQ